MSKANTVDLQIERQVELANFTTMAARAEAAYFVRVRDKSQLLSTLDYAKERQLKVFVLGEGSNTVFANDFSGMVIRIDLPGIECVSETTDSVTIDVAAGESWHGLVKWCLAQGLCGLENLALIPGLVGAAPIQNIGAYGVEVENFIDRVDFIHLDSGVSDSLAGSQCDFAYRDSVFKRRLKDRVIITSVRFKLPKRAAPNLSYPALAGELDHTASAEDVFKVVCRLRREKLPSPARIPNSGSFFKNPVVARAKFEQLKADYPDLVAFAHGQDMKLAAAWLIEHAGWKNRHIDGVSVHQQQALVLINPHRQAGDSVLRLAYSIQLSIKQQFGIELEIEPRVVC